MPFFIAIPDVQGEISQLEALIAKIEGRYDLGADEQSGDHRHGDDDHMSARKPKAQLIFLGDLIDRGEDSDATIEYVQALKQRWPHTQLIWGNHELQTLALSRGSDERGLTTPLRPGVLEFLRDEFVPWVETPSLLFCHGSPAADDTVLDPRDQKLISQIACNYAGLTEGWRGKFIVRGHTAGTQPARLGLTYFLDCNAADYEGTLIASVFRDLTIHELADGRRRALQEPRQSFPHEVSFNITPPWPLCEILVSR
ncbi:MAG TPA: metallophosphoesterase [Pseudobdellovibrionaceae bacterium]|nr:metallophosphoesterase [Pseudobdellovibrionaceae bacterium]